VDKSSKGTTDMEQLLSNDSNLDTQAVDSFMQQWTILLAINQDMISSYLHITVGLLARPSDFSQQMSYNVTNIVLQTQQWTRQNLRTSYILGLMSQSK